MKRIIIVLLSCSASSLSHIAFFLRRAQLRANRMKTPSSVWNTYSFRKQVWTAICRAFHSAARDEEKKRHGSTTLTGKGAIAPSTTSAFSSNQTQSEEDNNLPPDLNDEEEDDDLTDVQSTIERNTFESIEAHSRLLDPPLPPSPFITEPLPSFFDPRFPSFHFRPVLHSSFIPAPFTRPLPLSSTKLHHDQLQRYSVSHCLLGFLVCLIRCLLGNDCISKGGERERKRKKAKSRKRRRKRERKRKRKRERERK